MTTTTERATGTALGYPSVLEITSPVTAVAGRFLADAGARVVKLERPATPLPARPEDRARRLYQDTDKRSLTLDLDSSGGRELLARLAPRFDIVVESGEPGWLASLGAGYDVLSAANPAVTLVSVTPFGQWGPYAHYQADDLVAFAMGGMMFVSGVPELPPVVAPLQQAYVVGGIHASMTALACWRAARRTGRGEWIDVSMVEALAAQENTLTNFKGGQDFTRREGSKHRNGNPGRVFRCRDGYVHLLIQHDEAVWARFLEWLGNPPELQGPAFANLTLRREQAGLIDAVTDRILLRRTREEIFSTGQEAHLPIAPVYSIAEALKDPQVQHMSLLDEVDGRGGQGYRTLHPPIQRNVATPDRTPAPEPGADSDAVLAERLGLSGEAVEALGGLALSRPLPLAGVRVLAFTHVAAGPYCTLQLAALGAEVIKVESKTRMDIWRWDKNRDPERSARFIDHNKNTRSVTLNLKTEEGRALARELAAKSDIVIENYSAGVIDRLGLGYDVLAKDHPELIMVHMSGLGSTGPRSTYVTYGPSQMAMSGMIHIWNHAEREDPVGSQTSYPDYLVGAYAAYAVVAAVVDRDQAGRGRELDLIQLDVVETAMGTAVVAAANGITEIGPKGNTDDLLVPHDAYPCAGGNDDWCVISVRSNDEWQALVRTMGVLAAADPRFATAEGRRGARAEVDALVAGWTRGRSGQEVMDCCQANGVPAGVVATGRDLAENPHFLERGFLLDKTHPIMGQIRLPGPPMRLGREPLEIWRLGPLLGEDNDYVLGTILERDGDEIARLQAEGVVA